MPRKTITSISEASTFVIVYSTVPDLRTAERIALRLLDEHLIACANILPPMISVYRWKSKACRSKERVLLLKTHRRHYQRIESRIRELHPYECPCIIALPLSEGSNPFLQWISTAVS